MAHDQIPQSVRFQNHRRVIYEKKWHVILLEHLFFGLFMLAMGITAFFASSSSPYGATPLFIQIALVILLFALINVIGGKINGMHTIFGRVRGYDTRKGYKGRDFLLTNIPALSPEFITSDSIFIESKINGCYEIIYFQNLISRSLVICKMIELDNEFCMEPRLLEFSAHLNNWIKQEILERDPLAIKRNPTFKFSPQPLNPRGVIFEYGTIAPLRDHYSLRREILPHFIDLLGLLETNEIPHIVIGDRTQKILGQALINRKTISDLSVKFIDNRNKYSKTILRALELIHLEPHECIVFTNSEDTRKFAETCGFGVSGIDTLSNPEKNFERLRVYLSSALGKNL